VGTPVTVVNQTIKYGRKNGDLYVEVHPSHAQLEQIEETGTMTFEETPDQTDRVLTVAKPEEISRIDWAAVDRAFAERRGLPVRITHPAAPTPPTRDEPQRLGSPELGTGTMPPLERTLPPIEKSGPATGPMMPGSAPPRSSGPRDSRLKSSSNHG
jgi:L,D-transpeptidase ErfK/SrfK